MCFGALYSAIVVELIAPLLWFPCSWSLLLAGTIILGFRIGVPPWSRWSFLKECTSSLDAKKMKFRNLGECFNVTLLLGVSIPHPCEIGGFLTRIFQPLDGRWMAQINFSFSLSFLSFPTHLAVSVVRAPDLSSSSRRDPRPHLTRP
jgi:hypothetical protein